MTIITVMDEQHKQDARVLIELSGIKESISLKSE